MQVEPGAGLGSLSREALSGTAVGQRARVPYAPAEGVQRLLDGDRAPDTASGVSRR